MSQGASGRTVRVRRGDTLSSLAAKHGLPSWKVIFDHPENEEFRRLRPDPNLIEPGDTVWIPFATPKWSSHQTGATHRFHLVADPLYLRLRLLDDRGSPLANLPCRVVVDGASIVPDAHTDEAGVLEVALPSTARRAEVATDRHVWALEVGDLRPIPSGSRSGLNGVRQRLANLAYMTSAADGSTPDVIMALKSFQRDQELMPTGRMTTMTCSRLVAEHGC